MTVLDPAVGSDTLPIGDLIEAVGNAGWDRPAMTFGSFWKRVDGLSRLCESGIVSEAEFVDAVLDEVVRENRPATLEEVYAYLSPSLRGGLLKRLRHLRSQDYLGWLNYVGPGMPKEEQLVFAAKLREIVESMERSGIINLDE